MTTHSIDMLFGRLHVRYGQKLFAAYDGIDMAAVKRDWAQVLFGLSERAINYGIMNLPIDWPPTAGKLREICLGAPAAPVARLEPPAPDPVRAEKALQEIQTATHNFCVGASDPMAWLWRLRTARANGQRMSAMQRHCLKQCEKVPSPSGVPA